MLDIWRAEGRAEPMAINSLFAESARLTLIERLALSLSPVATT